MPGNLGKVSLKLRPLKDFLLPPPNSVVMQSAGESELSKSVITVSSNIIAPRCTGSTTKFREIMSPLPVQAKRHAYRGVFPSQDYPFIVPETYDVPKMPQRKSSSPCKGGVRSTQALEILQAQGFTKLVNLKGGITAWSNDIDLTVPKY